MFDSIGNGPKGRLAGAAALAFMTVALGGQAAAQQAASPRSANGNGAPKLRATASLGHDWGPLSGFVQRRYVGKGRADVTLDDIAGLERNRIDAQWYIDLSGRYYFGGLRANF